MAQLYLRGLLGGTMLVNESVIGTVPRPRAARNPSGRLCCVIPEISGTAYIAGFCNWVLDARDPLRNGFLLCANASHPNSNA